MADESEALWETDPRAAALRELSGIKDENPGYQYAHEQADGVLVRLLFKLGYEDVVTAYEKFEKGYE